MSEKVSAFNAMAAFKNAMIVPIIDLTLAAADQNEMFTITQLKALFPPAGNDKAVQLNNSGAFGASDDFTFDNSSVSVLDINSAASDSIITFSEAGTAEYYLGHDQSSDDFLFGTGATFGSNLKLKYDAGDAAWDFQEIDVRMKRIFLEFSGAIEGSLATSTNIVTLSGIAGTQVVIESGGANAVTFGTDQVSTFASYVVLFITDTDGTVEGSLWYDASEDKLKFKTGAGVETITSA